MSVQRVPTMRIDSTDSTDSNERPNRTRPQSVNPLLARGLWLIVVIFTLTVFFTSLPLYAAQLQRPCDWAVCLYQQLTPDQAATLVRSGLSLAAYATLTLSLMGAAMVVCLTVSAVIIWRRSDDRMALLVALMLVTLGTVIGSANISADSTHLQVLNDSVAFLVGTLFVLVFSVFPSGQFVPRWLRWFFIIIVLLQVPGSFLHLAPVLPNSAVGQLGWLVTLGGFAVAGLAQLYRYRRVSNAVERQQTKWVVFGLVAPITVFVVVSVLLVMFPSFSEHDSLVLLLGYNESGFLLSFFVPLAFGFAMLRYRLWNIDAIINKALVYGSLTTLLAGVYAALVIGLQSLAGITIGHFADQPVALVISTLATVALFQPLRRRIQRVIDRRFYRRKYDAEKTLAALSAVLRHEVDLNDLSADLLAMVQETMEPAHVSLWLRPPSQYITE